MMNNNIMYVETLKEKKDKQTGEMKSFLPVLFATMLLIVLMRGTKLFILSGLAIHY